MTTLLRILRYVVLGYSAKRLSEIFDITEEFAAEAKAATSSADYATQIKLATDWMAETYRRDHAVLVAAD